MTRHTVLFICTHNSARSQMAEGYLRSRYGDRYTALSAGTEPSGVHPLAIKVMKEISVDISGQVSKRISEFSQVRVDFVVTVCDRALESCPLFPGFHKKIHINLPDPAGAEGTEEEKMSEFRRVRDLIAPWIDEVFG